VSAIICRARSHRRRSGQPWLSTAASLGHGDPRTGADERDLRWAEPDALVRCGVDPRSRVATDRGVARPTPIATGGRAL